MLASDMEKNRELGKEERGKKRKMKYKIIGVGGVKFLGAMCAMD
jgi:hypothetical protein